MTDQKKTSVDEIIRSNVYRDLIDISDEELETLRDVNDEQLLRASRTLDQFAVVESNRRLKNALHKEEKAIKGLTFVLVALTIILVILTLILVCK